MKSKIQKYQESNFKRVSTIICIHFAILLAMNVNSAYANNLIKKEKYQNNKPFKKELISELKFKTLKKPVLNFEYETVTTMPALYKKTIEEIIAEDNKIIENGIKNNINSNIEIANEKNINEDKEIIESNLTNELFPLDFGHINKVFNKF